MVFIPKNKALFLKHFLFILILLTGLSSLAQRVTLVDLQTNQPIPEVNVYNKDTSVLIISDNRGFVDISKFNYKEIVYFSHSAYQTEKLTLTDLTEKGFVVKMINDRILDLIVINPLRDISVSEKLTNRIEEISSQEVQRKNPATTADMLQQSAGILVQKSQIGGGSPVIRGFEANKILLVVDGVRMNNAIYRSGHLQNAVTIDNNILDHTNVYYGPSSVVYGSDALGGVVHFHTKNPLLSLTDSTIVKGNAMLRYASASNEKTTHIDVSFGSKRWGSLTSLTLSDFGDLKMGSNRFHGYEDYGKVPFYVKRINNKDSVIANPNSNVLKRTGYAQMDILQKITFAISDSVKLFANFQYSTSSNINRFDNLNQYRDGQLRFAEWYYGPQNRLLTSLKAEFKKDNIFFNYGSVIAAYQKIDEDRINRRLNSNTQTYREEDVQVYSINADFSRTITDKDRFFYGAEFTHNDVQSSARNVDITTNVISTEPTRYPDGGSTVSTAALYGAFDKALNKKLSLNIGTRYSRFYNNSIFNDTSLYNLPFNQISLNGGSLIGSGGITFQDEAGLGVEAIISTGYRAPNIDDYGKVFEDDGFVVVPNENLNAEHLYNAELNIAKQWSKKNTKTFKLYGTGYYSLLNDAIVRRDFTLNGSDSLIYEGENARIQANQNVDKVAIYGGVLGLVYNINTYLRLKSSATYTKGRDLSNNEPAAHIPPLFGNASIILSSNKWYMEFSNMFNGPKFTQDYAPGGTDNIDEATINGTPSWNIFSIRSSYQVSNNFKIQLNIENILDAHYKQFASGVSGSGRNFILAIRGNF